MTDDTELLKDAKIKFSSPLTGDLILEGKKVVRLGKVKCFDLSLEVAEFEDGTRSLTGCMDASLLPRRWS